MRDYYYTEELELALGYDNVDLQHLIYDICSKDKEKFLPFKDWVCEKRNEFKELGKNIVRNAIIKYVEYEEGCSYVWVRHEHWSAFSAEMKKALLYNQRKPFNNLGDGFDLHFDVDYGIGFKIDEMFGFWLKEDEFKKFYEENVYNEKTDNGIYY